MLVTNFLKIITNIQKLTSISVTNLDIAGKSMFGTSYFAARVNFDPKCGLRHQAPFKGWSLPSVPKLIQNLKICAKVPRTEPPLPAIKSSNISTSYSATGPALREKIYTMQNLYQKYKSTGLEEAETNNLLQIRKLLQLKTLVTTLLNDNRYLSRWIRIHSKDFEHFTTILCIEGYWCIEFGPENGQKVFKNFGKIIKMTHY